MNQIYCQLLVAVSESTKVTEFTIFSIRIIAVFRLVIILMEVVFSQGVSKLALVAIFTFVHFLYECPVA